MKTAGSSVEKALFPFLSADALCSGGYHFVGNTPVVEYPHLNNEFKEGNYIYTRFHQHTSPSDFYRMIKNKEMFEGYKTISLVRNPWETCLSYYWYNLSQLEAGMSSMNKNEIITKGMNKKDARKTLGKYLTTSAVIYNQSSLLDEEPCLQTTPLEFVGNTNESFVDKAVSYFIRYENLQNDFEKICMQFDLAPVPTLPILKSPKKPIKKHYSWFYDNYTKELVAKAFPKTIEKFGYKFERRSSK